MAESDLVELSGDDFARRFALRAKSLMWFLGAGASASAGIPTAGDMIWEFKQLLFTTQRRVSLQSVSDLSNAAVRLQLQTHIDASEGLPTAEAADEYAALFEAVYPAEADRRSYLDGKMAGAKPSYGHLALATMMRAHLTRLVWTTNFDPLVADGCAKVYGGTGQLSTAALDAPELAAQLIGDERWPIEVKLHGDFRSRRLKNTSDELRHQDSRLRQVLVDCCRRFGLIITGYSGRDDSVMDAIEEAVRHPGAFPAGLFWLHRGDGLPVPRVVRLLSQAVTAKVEAALVRVESFDEVFRDLIRLLSGFDTSILDTFASERTRWSSAPRPSGRRGWPVVRLNALPLILAPSVCRRIVCQIGGHAEARAAVEATGANVLIARTHSGVLAYGSDDAVRTAFDRYGITEFDLQTIETKRLRYDSGERGLLRDALTRALKRQHGLDLVRRRGSDLLTPSEPGQPVWLPLKQLVGGNLAGTVANHPDLKWHEGISIRLDWAHDRLWLLIDPRIVFSGITDDNKAVAADFARERTVKRYNRQLNDLLAFWAKILAHNGNDLRALGIADGIDAIFRLSSDTAFSKRAQA